MSNEKLNKENFEAMDAFICKLPFADLERAYGGLSEGQKRKLLTAGILALGVLGSGALIYKGATQQEEQQVGGYMEPPVIDELSRWRHYFYENGDVKKGFFIHGRKVYRESQRRKKSGIKKLGTLLGAKDWDFKEGEEENGIPIGTLIKEV